MNQLEIVFIDIDGTLLRSDRTISPRVKSCLRQVRENGVKLCLASGRSWEALLPLYKELEMDGPAICYNGAVAVEGPSGRMIFEHGMHEEVARFAISECQRMKIELIAYSQSRLLYEAVGREVGLYRQRVGLQGELVRFDEHHPRLQFTKCVAIGDAEALVPLEKSMSRNFSSEVLSITHSDPRFLELMGPGVNKGEAVKKLCELKGFNLAATAAFGDGWNDVEMLQAVAQPWLMNGSDKELKKLFPGRVVPESDSDGLALPLEAFLAQPRLYERKSGVVRKNDGAE